MGTSVEMIDVTYGHLVADHADAIRVTVRVPVRWS
jgi:hypothetical protein